MSRLLAARSQRARGGQCVRDAPEPLRLLTCSHPCVYKLARPVWLLFFFFFLLWLCMVVKEALATRFPSTASCTRDNRKASLLTMDVKGAFDAVLIGRLARRLRE